MKHLNLLLALGLLTSLSACAFHDTAVLLKPVGPEPAPAMAADEGYLVVYSAWDPLGDRYYWDHSGYKIVAPDGKLVKWVTNAIDYSDEDPVRVALPPGSYQVNALSQDDGRVLVPVVVKGGQTTFVYLDGSQPLRSSSANPANFVKLPNGELVGWAANTK